MAMTHYGFNFLWMFIWEDGQTPPPPDEQALDFMADTGFNFVRVPTDYRFWTKDFDYFHPDESVFTSLDTYLEACRARGFQMCLNIHRAPGYCINRNDLERDNLWLDPIAQDAFVFQWELFAQRYRGVPSSSLSFDLLNEPPNIGQYGLSRENHAALVRRTVAAIRAIDPEREIVADGLGGGSLAMPELADLDVIQSGRGYQPMPVSHAQANWWAGYTTAPAAVYPGLEWEGITWNRDTLREFYQPWRDIESAGAKVHIGECGCFNKTPNDVALRWLNDIFGLYREFGWGYALWNFAGPFGIADHGREGARYEKMHGYNVDSDLLALVQENRVSQSSKNTAKVGLALFMQQENPVINTVLKYNSVISPSKNVKDNFKLAPWIDQYHGSVITMSISDKATKASRKVGWTVLNAMSKDRASKPKILYSKAPVEEGQSPEYVHSISGPAYIEPEWGYVISASGRLWEEPLITYLEGHAGQPWRFGIPSPRQFLRVHRQQQGRIIRYPKVVSLRFIWEWNYFHFYADVLGKLSLLDEAGVDPALPLVLGKYAHEVPFVQQIIRQGALKDRNWIIAEDTHVLADEVIYATRREDLRQRYNYLLNQMKPPNPSDAEERIFLMRGKPHLRCILNNEEVSQITQQWGFRTVDTAKMSIADQIILFSRTRYLIAAHGAGFINMIFRQDAPMSFLELHAENYLPGLSRELAEAYSHTWIGLSGKPDNLATPQSSNYYIDPDALNTKIEQILAS